MLCGNLEPLPSETALCQRIPLGTTAWKISMGRHQVVQSVHSALRGAFADLPRGFLRGDGPDHDDRPARIHPRSVERRTPSLLPAEAPPRRTRAVNPATKADQGEVADHHLGPANRHAVHKATADLVTEVRGVNLRNGSGGSSAAGPGELLELRHNLLIEELRELVAAIDADDIIGVADALGDMVYVLYGTAATFGINLDAVVAAIHKSNMSKLGIDGKPVLRADGKVLKGPKYRPPAIHDALGLAVGLTSNPSEPNQRH